MKKVLFVCVENSCRSQMAEGFARIIGKGVIEAYSAGSRPSGKVNPLAIEVMKEAGIDISMNKSKCFNDIKGIKFDYVVTLGCGDTCPFVSADKHIHWDIQDPKRKDIEFFRITRDETAKKITDLVNGIK
jgi:protein-tyrosine-phosphatase